MRAMTDPAIGDPNNRRTVAEARWKAIVDSAVDAIMHNARAVESFNPAAEWLFGIRGADAGTERQSADAVALPRGTRPLLEHYIQTGEQKIIGIGRQVTARRQDGSTFRPPLGRR
jgi:hypothetical protein